jgi:hypothetical protein
MIIKNVMDEFSKRGLHNWYLYFVTKSLKILRFNEVSTIL